MLRNILLGVGVFAALLSVLIFSGKIPLGNKDAEAKGEVVLWGTIDEQQMNRIVQEFNPKATTYRVVYREVPAINFNQILLEALANGTPVMVSKQSGVSEVVSHALKVNFWDTDEMANEMLFIAASFAKRMFTAERGP